MSYHDVHQSGNSKHNDCIHQHTKFMLEPTWRICQLQQTYMYFWYILSIFFDSKMQCLHCHSSHTRHDVEHCFKQAIQCKFQHASTTRNTAIFPFGTTARSISNQTECILSLDELGQDWDLKKFNAHPYPAPCRQDKQSWLK